MRLLLALLALMWAGPAVAAPADDFHILLADHWAWVLRTNPTLATTLGVRTYDDQLEDLSLAALDRDTAQEVVFLNH